MINVATWLMLTSMLGSLSSTAKMCGPSSHREPSGATRPDLKHIALIHSSHVPSRLT